MNTYSAVLVMDALQKEAGPFSEAVRAIHKIQPNAWSEVSKVLKAKGKKTPFSQMRAGLRDLSASDGPGKGGHRVFQPISQMRAGLSKNIKKAPKGERADRVYKELGMRKARQDFRETLGGIGRD